MVVEFAMNDGTNVGCAKDGSGTVPARASFERLLRKLQVGAFGKDRRVGRQAGWLAGWRLDDGMAAACIICGMTSQPGPSATLCT